MSSGDDGRWPDVTTILLMREPGEREIETVRRARSQRYGGTHVLLAVDSSPDPDAENNVVIKDICDRYMRVQPESFHHARTRNEAVRNVDTPVTVFLSSDAQPVGETWLEAMVRPIADGDAEVSYGRQRPPEANDEREATYRYLYPDEPYVKTKASIAELGFRALHFSDVSSAYLTDTLRVVPFPEEISIFQDAAISKALLDAGKRIAYVPNAEVLHAHPMRWRYMWNRYRGLGEVYERIGLLDDLKAARSGGLRREGLSAVRRMVPRSGVNPLAFARACALGGVKAAAFAMGRRDARKRPPLTFEWTPEEGSKAIRR